MILAYQPGITIGEEHFVVQSSQFRGLQPLRIPLSYGFRSF